MPTTGDVIYTQGRSQLVYDGVHNGVDYAHIVGPDGTVYTPRPALAILVHGYWEPTDLAKHGNHNQQSHAGRRGTDTVRRAPRSDEPQTRRALKPTVVDDIRASDDAVARALIDGDYSGMNIGSSRLVQRLGGKVGETERKVANFAERYGIRLRRNKRYTYTAEQAQALRESYYEKYGRPSWMQKAVAWLKGLFDE